MLYNVSGTIRGTAWKEKYCEECGALTGEWKKEVTRLVHTTIDAAYPDRALALAEEQSGFDPLLYEWAMGPFVEEVPEDQVLIRLGAPMLPGMT